MSGYTEQSIQDAKRKSIEEGRGLVGFVEHFLAALVPDGSEAVMVLKDGRVVALEKVVAKYCEPVPHELPDEVYEGAILQSWLDATWPPAEGEA